MKLSFPKTAAALAIAFAGVAGTAQAVTIDVMSITANYAARENYAGGDLSVPVTHGKVVELSGVSHSVGRDRVGLPANTPKLGSVFDASPDSRDGLTKAGNR